MCRGFEARTGEEMRSTDRWGRLVRLVRGRRRRISVRAVEFAVALFVVVAAFEFVWMASVEELVYLDIDRGSFEYGLVTDIVDGFAHPLLLAGLAGLHAYLNEGYLPSLLLAAAPAAGASIWIFSGPHPGPYVLTLKPLVGHWEWVPTLLRLAVLPATLGFLLGILTRRIRLDVLGLPEPG